MSPDSLKVQLCSLSSLLYEYLVTLYTAGDLPLYCHQPLCSAAAALVHSLGACWVPRSFSWHGVWVVVGYLSVKAEIYSDFLPPDVSTSVLQEL